jgi:2-polyprenyl-3-methyl-5-hydroxy-6-metoxy-1,4-benzoquinol methylase
MTITAQSNNSTNLETAHTSQQLEVARHYDEVWQENPGESWDTWPFFRLPGSALSYALAALGDLQHKQVLDLGCGIGYTPLELAKRGAQVTAVDLSAQAVQTTRQRAMQAGYGAQVEAIRANVEQLPFADASFDVIYAQNFLMHVSHRAVGRECFRLLRPGGKLVVVEPLAHHPLVRLYRRFFSDYKGTHPRYSSHEDMATLASFFNRARETRFYLLAALATLEQKRLLEPVYTVLNSLDTQLLKSQPFLRDWCWVTVLELYK